MQLWQSFFLSTRYHHPFRNVTRSVSKSFLRLIVSNVRKRLLSQNNELLRYSLCRLIELLPYFGKDIICFMISKKFEKSIYKRTYVINLCKDFLIHYHNFNDKSMIFCDKNCILSVFKIKLKIIFLSTRDTTSFDVSITKLSLKMEDK